MSIPPLDVQGPTLVFEERPWCAARLKLRLVEDENARYLASVGLEEKRHEHVGRRCVDRKDRAAIAERLLLFGENKARLRMPATVTAGPVRIVLLEVPVRAGLIL